MTFAENRFRLLGLFPELGTLGGVEASGRLAWEGLVNAAGNSAQCELFEYKVAQGGEPKHSNGANGVANGNGSRLTPNRSKAGAIFRALKTQTKPTDILVWHLGLLKLVPFFRSPDARITVFLHGIESWRKQDFLTQRLMKRVGRFVVNSDFTWSRFLTYQSQVRDVPHLTVSLGIGKPFKGALPYPAPEATALMVGRLASNEAYKGHREVIAAWPRVRERVPNARLWIAGDGDLRSELESRVKGLGLEESVQFWGAISETKKEELIFQSRCLALPSRGEGFGLVYLESMRLGRPCLVSDVDAGREVVNPPEAGLAANPDDLDELAQSLIRLLSAGDEWDQWSQQARKRYEERFTARHFQKRLCAALFHEAAYANPTR